MIRQTRIKIKKALAWAGLLSTEMVVITLVFLISIAGFSYLVKEIFIDKQQGFDQAVFAWVAHHVSPGKTNFMQYITFLGTHYFLIPANLLLTAYFLVLRKHKWYSIKVASIALSSTAIMLLLKLLFSRERPLIPLLEPARGYSFPSGHSMISFAFYGLLMYLAYKHVSNIVVKWILITLLAGLILMIGFSRIYLRVHYATDVAAGFCVGIVWLFISLNFLNRLERYSRKTLEPLVEEEPLMEGTSFDGQ